MDEAEKSQGKPNAQISAEILKLLIGCSLAVQWNRFIFPFVFRHGKIPTFDWTRTLCL